MDENAPNWTFEEYEKGLSHPLAERQFVADLEALGYKGNYVVEREAGSDRPGDITRAVKALRR